MLDFSRYLRIMTFILLGILSGCSSNESHRSNNPSLREMNAGVIRLIALSNENLDLSQIKEIYNVDFDENSKSFNDKTHCTEYRVYPFGKKANPIFLGFDSNNKYVYSIDRESPKLERRTKIIWVKDVQKMMSPEK